LRAVGRAPGAALLLQEMERATVVSDPPQHVLAMNGKATFDYDGRLYRDFQLVYPPCADFTAGRISVLTPVGAALIGLAEGKTLSWKDDARVEHSITVRAVLH
jgi:regulator of nucleoside diphosphate kinase